MEGMVLLVMRKILYTKFVSARGLLSLLALSLMVGVAFALPSLAGALSPIKLISTPDGAAVADGYCEDAQMNSKGQIVFMSSATNLGYENANNYSQVYLWDQGKLTLVSSRDGKEAGDLWSGGPQINEKGQITFSSAAPNLNDAGSTRNQIYLWDKGELTLVSAVDGVMPGDFDSYGPVINNQGQIAFTSSARNFGYANTFPYQQIYLWDNGTLTLVSSLDGNTIATGWTAHPQMNDNTQITFASSAANLNSAGSKVDQVYLWDAGTLTVVSMKGTALGNAQSGSPHINAKGQVVFGSVATNFNTEGRINNQVYLWDNGNLTLVSSKDGIESANSGWTGDTDINDAGQIVFSSSAPNLNSSGSATDQVYLWENGTLTLMSSLDSIEATDGPAYCPRINNKGQVVFCSAAPSLNGDGSSCGQVYLWENGALTLISTPDKTTAGTDWSGGVAINDNGQIVFLSNASNLNSANDGNNQQVYLYTPATTAPSTDPGKTDDTETSHTATDTTGTNTPNTPDTTPPTGTTQDPNAGSTHAPGSEAEVVTAPKPLDINKGTGDNSAWVGGIIALLAVAGALVFTRSRFATK